MAERVALTKDELLKVLTHARQTSVRDWALLVVTYTHGLRASEVASLKTSDVRDGVLRVERCKGSRSEDQPICSIRGTPVVSESAALKRWKETRPQYPGDDSLFPSQKGIGGLCREHVTRIFRRHAEAVGLPKGKRFVHILKHSRCSHLLEDGMPITSVQRIVGHKALSSTLKYCHTTTAQAFAQAAAMTKF
jgi:site-specific recombinase XerD